MWNLTQDKIPYYEVEHSFFKNLARAQITGQTVWMLKNWFHRETLYSSIHVYMYDK